MKKILDPRRIEEKSFEIISALLQGIDLPCGEKEVVKRVIHATTEVNYAKDLIFHPGAVKAGVEAIKNGKNIICDVNMVKAGINKKALAEFGGKVECFIDDEAVAKQAVKLKIAKAILAMRKAAKMMDGAIVAIGNAPTALFELCDLVKAGKVKPALIIGIPVGFVGAVESKKYLTGFKIPYITNSSTKGGSSVAAAITNALLKLARCESPVRKEGIKYSK